MEAGTAGAVRAAAAPEASLEDLVADITRHLEDAGVYRLTLPPGHPQRMVDLRWAALRAGRLLGRRVRVVTSRAVHTSEIPITVRMSCAPVQRGLIPPMREESGW
jgi:hypothetical protein